MEVSMGDAAVTPTLPDAGGEPEFRPTARERLGIATFVIMAVVATTTWIVVLAWAGIQIVKHL